MTGHSSSPSWAREGADLEALERDDLVQLGVWMFLATVVMLFAAFTSVYIVQRRATGWTPIDLPSILKLNIAVLAGSSIALEWGRLADRQGRTTLAARTVALATGFGLLFLYGQVLALQALAARGVFLPTSPHGAFIYVLTGVHGVHVGAGLVVLAYTAVRLGIASGPGFPPVARLLTASATFWHFLAVLWIYVLLLITMF